MPGNIVHTVHIDLADLSSVKDCAARLSAQEPFDVLMLNAGVCSSCWPWGFAGVVRQPV